MHRQLEQTHPELIGEWKPARRKAFAEEADAMQMTQVAFRFPEDLIMRVDRHAERMRAAAPGVDINRADAVRSLLTLALDQIERASGPKRRK